MEKISLKAKVKVKNGQLIVDVKPWQLKWFEGLDEDLKIDFSEWSDKRSLRQNAMMWGLLSEIDIKENGRPSEDGELSVYRNVIKMAKIKTFDYEMPVAAYEETKKRNIFRVVDGFHIGFGKMFVRCYPGTSTFTKKEMADFLDSLLDYAEKTGIDTNYYREMKR